MISARRQGGGPHVAVIAFFVLTLAAASGAWAQSVSVHGMIVARNGPEMIIANNDGTQTTVTLTESTKVVATAGALGIRQSELAASDLITGLPVSVDAQQNGETLEATRVTFKQGDLKTARQVEAGTAQVRANAKAKVAELEAKDAEMRKRMSEANQYVEKGSTNVYFAVGSASLSAQSKADLKRLADQAQGVKGYMIGVTGYADATGSYEANQALSERRAEAVIRYLQKYGNIQPFRVLSSSAMGESKQTGDTSTAEGRAQNRRVEVKILTNKGLEGL